MLVEDNPCHLPQCPRFARVWKMTVIGGLRTSPVLFATLPNLKLKELYIEDFADEHPSQTQRIAPRASRSLCRSLRVLHFTTYSPERDSQD